MEQKSFWIRIWKYIAISQVFFQALLWKVKRISRQTKKKIKCNSLKSFASFFIRRGGLLMGHE